jgi:hypothetical protein
MLREEMQRAAANGIPKLSPGGCSATKLSGESLCMAKKTNKLPMPFAPTGELLILFKKFS